MNWLDIVIAIILAIGIFMGLKTGLIKMVISLAGLILGIFLAGRMYQSLADKLTFISSEKAAQVLAYIIILVLVMIVAAIVAWFLSKLISAIMLGWVNHLGGAVFGLLIAAIFVGAILAVWAKYGGGTNLISHSWLGKLLVDKFPLVLALLPGEFKSIRSFFK
jgi:membrane protein required for colicin V production